MGILSNIFDGRKVEKALQDYPIYSPPFCDAEAVLSRTEIEANYSYFLEQKCLRLECLARYLALFAIELSVEAAILPLLDCWLSRFGGHLIPNKDDVYGALFDHVPAWSGTFHGFNIINDIGILAGDYIVSRNADARWSAYFGNGTRRDYEEPGFGQPCLFGLRHPGYADRHLPILNEIFDCCMASRSRLLHGRGLGMGWDVPGAFVRRIEYFAGPPPLPSFS